MNKETVKTKDIKLNDFIQISSDTKEASNIIWHVIDRKDDRLLLIWENYYLQGIYGDRSIYSDGIVDYSDSVIRGCAIKTYNDIFDDNTKKHVLTDLDTGDKLYVLSSEEFNEYSSLVNFGVFTNQTAKLTNWWLRDLSDMKGDILFVNNSGEIYTDGYMPETESFYYRFAMWVDLDLTVDRITSPFKIVRPKITIDLEFPRNSKCSFPDTTLLNMKKDAIFEYKNNIYILKGLSWVAGSEGEMLNVTCISIKKGKRTTFNS